MREWDWFDYDGVARSRLTDYLTRDEQPGDFLTALISPLRDLEQVMHLMLDSLSIGKATGLGLDAFGEMVGLPRLGLDDDTYRQNILNRRFAAGGSGTAPDIKRVLRGLLNSTGAVTIVAHRPAAFVAYASYDPQIPLNIVRNVEAQCVAGVKPYVVQKVHGQGFKLAPVPSKPVNSILRVTPTASKNAMRVTPKAQNNALKVNSRIIAPVGSKFSSSLGDVTSNNPKYRTVRLTGALSNA